MHDEILTTTTCPYCNAGLEKIQTHEFGCLLTVVGIGKDVRRPYEILRNGKNGFEGIKDIVSHWEDACLYCGVYYKVDMVIENYILTSLLITPFCERELQTREMEQTLRLEKYHRDHPERRGGPVAVNNAD